MLGGRREKFLERCLGGRMSWFGLMSRLFGGGREGKGREGGEGGVDWRGGLILEGWES